MRWIYLSPHFDDAVLSCGGMIWQQTQTGHQVEIWTLCAGNPPLGDLPPFAAELHARWQMEASSVATRAAEDIAACQAVGAAWRHFDFPDCIYRRLPDGTPLIHNRDDLFDPQTNLNLPDVERVRNWLTHNLNKRCRLVAPLTIGGHLDHRVVRSAAEALQRPLWYYADYPYAAPGKVDVRAWLGSGWRQYRQVVTPAGLLAWQLGVAQYASQTSSFWQNLDEMRAALSDYLSFGGNILWARLKEGYSFSIKTNWV